MAWTCASAQTGTRTSTKTAPEGSGDNLPHTIIVVGKVAMADGSALPAQATIVSICGNNTRREAVTRPDGSFSFVLGDHTSSVVQDASNGDRGDSIYPGRNSSMTNNPGAAPAQYDTRTLADCQLLADLQGYESSHAGFPGMPSGTINVGVLLLRSHGAKADAVVSVTSLQAPSNAHKEFEKGKAQLDKGNLDDAEASLRKAVDEYPHYAEAWFWLGNAQAAKKDAAGALSSYERAQKADASYPPPYLPLARAAAQAHQWQDALSLSDRLIGLDAARYPMAYYYNAMANYNLNHLPEAEASALKAESLDKTHGEPRIEVLLGMIYTARQNYNAAAQHYKSYLQIVPDGPLSAQVKSDLAKCEEMAKANGGQDSVPKP
jgi:tetratricopeptide (TPR) repeat protein